MRRLHLQGTGQGTGHLLIRVPDFNWLLYEKAGNPPIRKFTQKPQDCCPAQPEVTMARLKHEAGGRGRQKRRESARVKGKEESIAEVTKCKMLMARKQIRSRKFPKD